VTTTNLTLQVNRARHAESGMVEQALPALGAGQMRFRVERCSGSRSIPAR
jgi:hypothetical protein